MGEQREFVHREGRFYSVIDEGATSTPQADGGRVFVGPAVGVWAMCDLVRELPSGESVRIVPRGPLVDENGRSWQERAIAAEMAAAQERTKTEVADRAAGRANTARVRAEGALREARDAENAALTAVRESLVKVVELIGEVYGRGPEVEELLTPETCGCEGPDYCEVTPPSLDDLIAFVAGTLAGPHPRAVHYPRPSTQVMKMATAAARRELGSPSGTVPSAVGAVLRAALEASRIGFAGTTPGWRDAPAGTPCGLCGHERGEHTSPEGRDCESTRTPSGRMCGCRGLHIELGPSVLDETPVMISSD